MSANQQILLAQSRGVITGANLVTQASPTDATSYTSTAFTPTAKAVILVCCNAEHGSSVDPTLPTITDTGSLTWTNIKDFKWIDTGTSRARMQIFAAQVGASPASSTVTIDYGATNTQIGCEWSVVEFYQTAVNSGVAQCFVQSPTTTANSTGTSHSITLSAAAQPANRPFCFTVHMANEATNPRGSWTELGDNSHSAPAAGIETQYRADTFETTASAGWTTSGNYGGIALEIKAA